MIESTERLIEAALRQGLGNELAAVMEITCLDDHLHGHAFKYQQKSNRIQGVYPYRIIYQTSSGRKHVVEVMVKAKPSGREIRQVYGALLEKCGIRLKGSLEDCLRGSDYWRPNVAEAILFRDFSERLRPYLPRSLGVWIDGEYTLRLEKILPAGSVILSPDDDSTKQWPKSASEAALQGMATVHARFPATDPTLKQAGCFSTCDAGVMERGMELWRGVHRFCAQHCQQGIEPEFFRRQGEYVESLSEWYPQTDREPKSLLYGDINPQNLAFIREGESWQLCLFDWERVMIHLPQRDLAQFLIYTLPEGFGREEMVKMIAIYRRAWADAGGMITSEENFREGLRFMLQDMIINHLPAMLIVKKLTGKRPRSVQGYRNAHRLLELVRE